MTKLSKSCERLQNMKKAKTPDLQELRLEYEKTQDMAIHYDTLNWTIGSILIAGVFIMIGIIGDKTHLYPYIASFSFIALVVWNSFYKRHKEIQQIKFKRLHDIEVKLRLQQHLRVDCDDEEGRIGALKGYYCADILTIGIPSALIIVYGISIRIGIPSALIIAYLISIIIIAYLISKIFSYEFKKKNLKKKKTFN